MIPIRAHAILDYVVGVLLILAPFALGFANGGAAMYVPVLLGAALLIYSALTRYPLSLLKAIPLGIHLGLDLFIGIILALSPWFFSFFELVWWPHVVVGVTAIVVVLLTDRKPVRDEPK
ncbi:SPW repeat domain-containing protein [Pseudoroseicyclus tamaricis]|uniref:SPW repeat-containing integral membrane domain-containing protein n=1 Tax=Pseudoroseicyclus tamaricis TaxID=2705421 RepID=A0A6B2K3N2_9RHOB|nr:SPW repeat protein [Pseudoroseicyclus tamaricis]NDV02412.1 hypothetical protein [Pseudoroseicyclus tamaricis]